MDQAPSPLVWIAIAAVVIGIVVLQWRMAVQRRQDLASWAAKNGLDFDPGRDYGLEDRLPDFSRLNEGFDRYAYNVSSGRRGSYRVWIFDWHYCTKGRDSDGKRDDVDHRMSAVVVVPEYHLKPLLIRKETVGDRIGEFFGAEDIDFESVEFSRRYLVKSPDRRWAFDVLHQEAMEFLLSSSDFALEFLPGGVIAWRGAAVLTPQELDEVLRVPIFLLDKLPPSVIEELRGGM